MRHHIILATLLVTACGDDSFTTFAFTEAHASNFTSLTNITYATATEDETAEDSHSFTSDDEVTTSSGESSTTADGSDSSTGAASTSGGTSTSGTSITDSPTTGDAGACECLPSTRSFCHAVDTACRDLGIDQSPAQPPGVDFCSIISGEWCTINGDACATCFLLQQTCDTKLPNTSQCAGVEEQCNIMRCSS